MRIAPPAVNHRSVAASLKLKTRKSDQTQNGGSDSVIRDPTQFSLRLI